MTDEKKPGWIGDIAQAFANTSKYHVILRPDILEPAPGDPSMTRVVGRREVGHFVPINSLKDADR
jgi:hypothetical protein